MGVNVPGRGDSKFKYLEVEKTLSRESRGPASHVH